MCLIVGVLEGADFSAQPTGCQGLVSKRRHREVCPSRTFMCPISLFLLTIKSMLCVSHLAITEVIDGSVGNNVKLLLSQCFVFF